MPYGASIPEPTIDESTIPSGVVFRGWHTANNDLVDFTTIKVLGNIIRFPETMEIVLSAKWQDENYPVVDLTRVAFNKFSYHATDNMGVTAWAVTDSETISPIDDRWHEITPTTVFDGEYEIEAAGDYYFHIKDDQGNTSWAKTHADTISLDANINNPMDHDTDIIVLHLTENDVPVNDFAITGTTINVRATNDTHYENLQISCNGITLEQGDPLLINGTTVIHGSVTPRYYIVSFFMNGEGNPVPDQMIAYKHLIIEPDPQVLNNKYLAAWYVSSPANPWRFMEDVVLGDMTLTAQ